MRIILAGLSDLDFHHAQLEDIDMMTFPDSGNFRGIVFLTFKTAEAAASALQFDGEDCDGKTLKVPQRKLRSRFINTLLP